MNVKQLPIIRHIRWLHARFIFPLSGWKYRKGYLDALWKGYEDKWSL